MSGYIPADGAALAAFHYVNIFLTLYLGVRPTPAATAPEEETRVTIPIRKSQNVGGLKNRRGDIRPLQAQPRGLEPDSVWGPLGKRLADLVEGSAGEIHESEHPLLPLRPWALRHSANPLSLCFLSDRREAYLPGAVTPGWRRLD